jgi:phospholipid/cholesterol/gamma-HCH transport system substrate-binding protein
MEFRARYLLMGVFVVVATLLALGFVYWLRTTVGLGDRAYYVVRFDTPAIGLWKGAPVLFNGVRVGDVSGLRLNPAEPEQLLVDITVEASTPVRADTVVGLSFQGLAGVPAILMVGGTQAAGAPDGPLVADTAATEDAMTAARGTIQRVDGILAENEKDFTAAIANLSKFSEVLGGNADRFEKIAAGLEKMVGSSEGAEPASVDLAPAMEFAAGMVVPPVALVVETPTALILFDTQRVLVRSADGTRPDFATTKWSDNLPLLVQQALIRSFENARFDRVGRPDDGFNADDHLLVEIRDFAITEGDAPAAEVALAAKLVGGDGTLLGSQLFTATAPVSAMEGGPAAAALNQAFTKAATALVEWTAATIDAPPPAPLDAGAPDDDLPMDPTPPEAAAPAPGNE